MSLTTDPKDPALKEGQKNETGQHDIYLVLSQEERAKGFVRPVRDTYIHVGKKLCYEEIWYLLDEKQQSEMKKKFPDKEYFAVMVSLKDKNGKIIGGSYVTKEEYDHWQSGKLIGGCGTETRMGLALAETYARNPLFYGATFCCYCNKHLPVDEFVWKGTNQIVGS